MKTRFATSIQFDEDDLRIDIDRRRIGEPGRQLEEGLLVDQNKIQEGEIDLQILHQCTLVTETLIDR